MIKKAFTKIALGEFRGFQDEDEEKPIVKATIFFLNLPIFFTKYNRSIVLKMLLLFQKFIKEYEYSTQQYHYAELSFNFFDKHK